MTAAIAHRNPPLPPEWVPFEIEIPHPKLWRWVLLSLLLHVFAILIFGAPSGGSREGRAMWGSLRVMLQRKIEPPLPAPAPRSEPAPEAPREPVAREALPEPVPIESFPPLLDRLPGLEPLPQVKPLVIPPPTDVQVIPVPPPAPKPAAPLESAPEPPAPAPITAPAPMPAPIQIPAPAPIPAPLLQPITPPIETPALPVERAPEIRVPAETPPIPAPLLQPIPQVQERSLLPPIERAPAIETPALPAERAPDRVAPPAAPEAVRPAPTPEVVRPEAARPEPVRPQPVRPEVPRQESVRPEAVRPEPVPGREPVTQPPAAPSPTESPFRRREEAAPSSTYDPTKPALDPDAFRRRASELAREGTGQRAPLAFPLPPVDRQKSKLETAIENARKPDCREAYKGLGLLAVAPLIANEFGEGTCRW